MNHFFKKHILLLIISTAIGFNAYSQHTIETADRFTNSLKNSSPRDDIYLVVGFTNELEPYFFDENSESLITILDESGNREEKKVIKSDLYSNRKTGFREYYYPLGSSRNLDKVEPFDLYFSSVDGMNYSKVSVTKGDKSKLIKLYQPPEPGASNKEKTKYYKKTGNSQGILMGANNDVVWKKRTKCSVKKRKYGKDGINGVKEMTYGMK